jgi:hypothetical protein
MAIDALDQEVCTGCRICFDCCLRTYFVWMTTREKQSSNILRIVLPAGPVSCSARLDVSKYPEGEHGNSRYPTKFLYLVTFGILTLEVK